MARCTKNSKSKDKVTKARGTNKVNKGTKKAVAKKTVKKANKSTKKGKKKAKRLSVKTVRYLSRNLSTLDSTIMHAFVVKDLEENTASQFSYYKARSELWCV